MNGRDIGTVVFPAADFKFFLTATPEARAERRLAEERQLDSAATFEETLAEMTERDRRDSTREDSPLVAASDAVVLDTTDVPIESSRDSYDANIKPTHYYLFQKQTIVANKDQLFYRQNEQFQPQTIRDTLPILLGVSSRDKYELESHLRAAQRESRLNGRRPSL